MTIAKAVRLVARWVRYYTRGLPAALAARRIEEISVDVHDHVTHERVRGTSDRRIALAIVWRMARGMPADLSWRRQVRDERGDFVKPFVAVVVAALGVAAIALILDSPVLIVVSVAMLGADILGVFALGLRTARRGAFVVPFVAILAGALVVAAIGVAAVVFGERGDAPGLVLLGITAIVSVVVGAVAIGARTAQRSN